MNNYRGTGRTTKIVDQAKKLRSEGKEVFVIAAASDVPRMRQLIRDPYIKVIPHSRSDINWELMIIMGYRRDANFLFDHFAIETHHNDERARQNR